MRIRERIGPTVRRLFVGILSQSLSSLTNIVLLVLLAHLLSPEQFAPFAVAQTGFVLCLGANQALCLERLVSDSSAAEPSAPRAAVTASATFALLCTVALLAVCPFVHASGLLIATALLVLTGLVQDSLRWVAASVGQPKVALVSDAVLLASQAVGISTFKPHHAVMALVVAAGANFVAVLVAILNLGRTAALPRTWVSRSAIWQVIRPRFLLEYSLGQGVSMGALLAVGVSAGAAITGQVRILTLLYGPINVLYNGARTFASPLIRDGDPRRGRLVGTSASFVVCLAALAWTIALLDIPGPGKLLAGKLWTHETRGLVVPMGLQVSALGVSLGALLLLRTHDYRQTLRLRILSALLVAATYGVLLPQWGIRNALYIQGLGYALIAIRAWRLTGQRVSWRATWRTNVRQ